MTTMKKRFSIILLTLFAAVLLTAPVSAPKAQFSDTYELIKAVRNKDMGEVRSRIFSGANVNARADGDPVLVIAIKGRYYDIARLLLDNGAYVNMESIPQQETALMYAAAAGDEDAVKLLLEFRADVNAGDRQGRTALMKAASNRQEEIVEMLIEAGADVFQTDYVGRDALRYAQEARARGVVKLLEDAGAR